MRTHAALVIAAAVAIVASSCASRGDEQVVVFAASSLVDAFDRIEAEYETAYPGVDVVMSYGGSSSLVAQIAAGAPVDVLATADPATMGQAGSTSTFHGDADVFATNSMVIAVEAGNPLGLRGVADLANVPVVVLAAVEVPAGRYAQQVLECEGITVEVASFEQNVRAVASKVALGEADAALVYRTDISEMIDAVEIDRACDVVAEYPIAALTDRTASTDFVAFVGSAAGAAALRDAGFEVT